MIYSKRLVGPVVPANGVSAIATVPAGKVWIIKRVCTVNYGAAATFPTLYLGGAFAANKTMWQKPGGVAAGAASDDETRVIYTAGEVVGYAGNNAGSLALYGYELDV